MPQKYKKKKRRQHNILYTVMASLLLSVVFLTMVSNLYENAEDKAYEDLHVQTKQIKDDLQLQIKSDNENLMTLANFAAKLYSDNESYNLIFSSFKAIGLIENVGILTEDNKFITKVGEVDLTGAISFEDEAKKGAYISSRVADVTNDEIELIRSAVPIRVEEKTVGILYGGIKLNTLNMRYGEMAKELDAQLFVYDENTGDLIIDPINEKPGNISSLKNRKYNDDFSYEEIMEHESGYSSFVSDYSGENLYIHYSKLDIADWSIMLARSEQQVFGEMNKTLNVLLVAFAVMATIIVIYMLVLIGNERRTNSVILYASKIRKQLLEINQRQNNISEALRNILNYSKSRSAIYVDTDGEDYNYVLPSQESVILCGDDRKIFVAELFRYAAEVNMSSSSTVSIMSIKPNSHLEKTNYSFYIFLKEHGINKVTFAIVIDKNKHISLLGVINPKNESVSRALLEDIAVCFSIAIYNKKYLNRTEIEVVTDSLTGVWNRVAYKSDLVTISEEKPDMFACLYIDVNELHLYNNRYGHAAGDEMLLYIANILKEVFYGHRIYRMGGDEFLVFVSGVDVESVKRRIETFTEQLKPNNYHVAIGMSYRERSADVEEMVKEAEVRMYEAKAQYYQNKEQVSVSATEDAEFVQVKTGIAEIDTMISIIKEHYLGIYRVDLKTDSASGILKPCYLGNTNEERFSKTVSRYIDELVSPDFRRAAISFLNYDAIKRQLAEGKVPRITYKKINGETVILSIYNMKDTVDNVDDTLWVFARD